jgi:hypothetical protein
MVDINAVLPMLAMKDGADIKHILKNVLLMDLGRQVLPAVLKACGNVWTAWRSSKPELYATVDPNAKESSILLHRHYDKDHGNEAFDALSWRLCQLSQTKHMKVSSNGVFVIANHDAIYVEDDIYAQQKSVSFDDKNDVKEACIEVYSKSADLMVLKKYLSELEHSYVLYRDNQLGNKLYYFDEIPQQLPMSHEGDPRYDMLAKTMTFTKTEMNTNKSMSNMYGGSLEVVRKRVHFFLNNKKWYADKGIAHTLGILLFGKHGCGKTSICKALSKDTNRHVFNIRLSEATTVSQINALFFSERVSTVCDGATETYNIPIDKRLIVMEDIDCLSDIVMERKAADPDPEPSDTAPDKAVPDATGIEPAMFSYDSCFCDLASVPTVNGKEKKKAPINHSEKLTLGYLLNVLDGVLETPGRIIVMTSNHPDKLDKALVRPGRIDVKVLFDKSSVHDIHEMIERICDRTCDVRLLSGVPDRYWTPAEVTAKIFENIEDVHAIVAALSQRTSDAPIYTP